MRTKAAAYVILLVVFLASTSFAAVCPQVTTLGSLNGSDNYHPLRVAVDAKGNTYATDAKSDSVNVYDYSGNLVNRKYVEYPLGVAVDGEGRVYVGNAEALQGGQYSGTVTVYDSGLNPLYTLGSGEGEFNYPVGMATDSERIYVADSRANLIKVYSIADGSFLFEFGGYGMAPGNLVRPDNVSVHPSTGNLYVTDRALVYDSQSGGYAMGAGVHEFTRDGVLVRSFGSYGFDEIPGVISLIGGMAVDNAGRVLVSDYNKGYLHVFDSVGTPVCIARYDGSYGSLPQGLAAAADGRLFIGASGRVIELGLDTYIKMAVSPGELSFSAQGCGPQPASQDITISNSGPGVLNFSISSDSSWLTVSAASGEVAGVGSASVSVQVNRDGLAPGTYTGTLTVSYAGGEQTVAVAFEVLPPSVLSVSPASLSFYSEGDPTPPSQTLNVELTGGGTWSAASDSTWLGIGPSGGPSDTLTVAQVSVDATGLGSGQLNGNITITSACAANSPVVVPVVVDLVMGGTIEVNTNLDEASYDISGPMSFSGTGTASTFEGAPAGTYTITFDDVAGFKTPASYSLDVAAGQTATFSGEYVDLRKRLNILAASGRSDKDTNELNIFGGDGELLASIALRDQVTNKYYWDNSIPASGDVDGDGVEELIISHDVGVITGLEADGTLVPGLDFRPFDDRSYVDVAVSDVDGDGRAEIIVGSMNWSSNGASVRIFSYDGEGVVDTGVYFYSYSSADWKKARRNNRRGTKVATGDMDGDGVSEILTVQGGGFSRHYAYVRIFKVDTSGGMGGWTVTDAGELRVNDVESNYSDIAAGDLDADGADEVIVSVSPKRTDNYQDVRVMAFSAAGDRLLDFTVDSIRGVEVAAGDTDYDGIAEIVVGEGAFKDGDSSRIRVFNAQGQLMREFMAFGSDVYGVRISTGQVVDNK